MKKIRFSFAPLSPEAMLFLEEETNVAFRHLDMRHWLTVTAFNDHDAVVGVLTMEPRNWFDWHMSCAIADQRLMSKRLLRTIFRTTFTRAKRITALVEPGNERAIGQMRRLGFVYEGFIRCGLEGHRDVLMFGMLPEDCRFLPGARAAGTVTRTDIAGAVHGVM